MGKAPRKQLASKAAKAAAPPVPLLLLSEFVSFLDSQYDTNSPEGMRVYDVKTKAGNLANDLIDNNQIKELGEKLADSYLEEFKLKNNPADAVELSEMKEDVSDWVSRMIDRRDTEEIRMNYINSTLEGCADPGEECFITAEQAALIILKWRRKMAGGSFQWEERIRKDEGRLNAERDLQ